MDIAEQLKAYTKFKNAEIPVVIGVSAHRDLDEAYLPAVREQIKRAIESIKRLCPHSPLVMLNGLAQGGDMLCAEVALALGVSLKVVLPRPEEEYLSDLDFTPEAKQRYRELRARATDLFVAPDTERIDCDNDRDYCFRKQTIYVATNCHVLLAVCDGEPTTGDKYECGANAAVEFALKHNYFQPNGMEFHSAYDGAVAHVFAPKRGKTYGNMPEIKCRFIVPERFDVVDGVRVYKRFDNVPKSLRDVLVRTDVFNCDYVKYMKSVKNGKSERAEYLIGEREYGLGGDRDRALHDCMNVASALSGAYKKKYLRGAMTLAVFGVLLILFFMLYDQLSFYWTAVVCFVMLFVLVGGYIAVNIKDSTGLITKIRLKWQSFDVHARFVEYRALAETLRVQYYISADCMDDNVCAFFTWAQKNRMAWVRKAVTALNAGSSRPVWECEDWRRALSEEKGGATSKVFDYAADDYRSAFENAMFVSWVGVDRTRAEKNGNGQLGYHLASVKEQSARIKRRNVINTVALAITLVTYFALFICELIVPQYMDKCIFGILTLRMLGKSVLSVFTAVTFILTYYYGKQSLDCNRADSLNMISLYTVALDRIAEISKSCTDVALKRAALCSLVRELAREQLVENGTWVAYNRDNSLDLPI